MEKELKLVFVSKLSLNHKGEYEYEFIFSDDSDACIGEGWEDNCAGEVNPPEKKYISKVGRLTLDPDEIELEVLTEMEDFCYYDGVFQIISLAWEFIEDYAETKTLPENLLTFRFGESLKDVEAKLYAKDKKLKF